MYFWFYSVQSSRKRSGGICLREPDSDEESDEPLASSESEEEEESEDAEENYENQEEQKKRVDNIWTSMKNDKNVKKNSKTLEEVCIILSSSKGVVYLISNSCQAKISKTIMLFHTIL